jgi:hypothetical protein
MYVWSLIDRERRKQFSPNLAHLCLETRKRFKESRNSESTVFARVAAAPRVFGPEVGDNNSYISRI